MTSQNFSSLDYQRKHKNNEPNRPIFSNGSETPQSQRGHVEEQEDDYDSEDANEDEEYSMVPNSGKSRSFIVTIDEHNPKKG